MHLRRLLALDRRFLAEHCAPVRAAPRARAPCRARTPSTSLLAYRPTIRVRPPPPCLVLSRIASGATAHAPASSSANSTVPQGREIIGNEHR